MRGRNAHHLGHVQCRTATETDDAVRFVRLVSGSTIHHLTAGGVAKHAAEHCHIQPRQMAFEFRQYRQRRQRFVRHDERSFEARLQQMGSHELACASTELDGGRKREICRGHLRGSIKGN